MTIEIIPAPPKPFPKVMKNTLNGERYFFTNAQTQGLRMSDNEGNIVQCNPDVCEDVNENVLIKGIAGE